MVEVLTNRATQCVAECERALALDCNLAVAHALIGTAKYMSGCSEKTESHIKEALRLSPRDKYAHVWLAQSGVAKLFLGDNEDAVAWLHRAIETNRSYPVAHLLLGACPSGSIE